MAQARTASTSLCKTLKFRPIAHATLAASRISRAGEFLVEGGLAVGGDRLTNLAQRSTRHVLDVAYLRSDFVRGGG
jgi:hypothetical protein